MSDHPGNRRIDRICEPSFVEGLSELELDELRGRRDECLAEREYLSLLRRLLQGRAEILSAELDVRGGDGERGPLVERLTAALAGDEHPTSRGEVVRISIPEEEMLLARRRVERLVSNAAISDPGALDDDQLAAAIESLVGEEQEVSAARRQVMDALDLLQEELKRRYKDDPALALR